MQQPLDFVEAARFCNEHGAHATTIDAVRIGLEHDPDNAMLYVYRAAAYDEFGRSPEAIADCETVLRLAPGSPAAVLALITLALVRARIGDIDGAFAAARDAIAIDPAGRESHAVLGTLLAWQGAYPQAWPELECHWIAERVDMMRRFPDLSEWDGEDIAGKRLLLVHGQGLGDLIQMLRYVPMVQARGITVLIECPAALLPIVAAVPNVAVIAKGAVSRDMFDVYGRVISLARICGEDGTPGHSGVPYVTAEPERVATWAARLGARDGRLRAGLVWAGNPFHLNDRRRSIPLAALASLGELANVEWISLQVGPRAADVAPAGLALTRFAADSFTSMADTAALIAGLDVVVAADTGVAHLAGAMGTPVRLVVPWRCDWRWRPGAAETPWYPSMRIHHATDPAWSGMAHAIAADLRRL